MNSDETLEQPTQTDLDKVLEAINNFKQEVNLRFDKLEEETNLRFDKLEKETNLRFDKLEKETNAQFEAIRHGIVDNSARFDRLEGNFLLLRANITELTEEVRHNRKVVF